MRSADILICRDMKNTNSRIKNTKVDKETVLRMAHSQTKEFPELVQHIESLPWTRSKKNKARLTARYLTALLSRFYHFGGGRDLTNYEYFPALCEDILVITTWRDYKPIMNELVEPLTRINEDGVEVESYQAGVTPKFYRFKNGWADELLKDLSPNAFLTPSALTLAKKTLEQHKISIEKKKRKNKYAALHHDNSRRWIDRLQDAVAALPSQEALIDVLLRDNESMSREKAIRSVNAFLYALDTDWLALENHSPNYKRDGLSKHGRIHTPANVLNKKLEAYLLAQPIYRLDIQNCHIVFLAVLSGDTALISDLREGKDIYTQLSTKNRKWAKERVLTLINHRDASKRLPLQAKFEELYPTAAAYLQKLKKRGRSFVLYGADMEQRLMRTAIDKMADNPLLSEIKFEHDGIASLNLEAVTAFHNALHEALEEPDFRSAKDLMHLKATVCSSDESKIYTEEQLDNLFCYNEEKEENELDQHATGINRIMGRRSKGTETQEEGIGQESEECPTKRGIDNGDWLNPSTHRNLSHVWERKLNELREALLPKENKVDFLDDLFM